MAAAALTSGYNQVKNFATQNNKPMILSWCGGYFFATFSASLLNITPVVGGVSSVIGFLAFKVSNTYHISRSSNIRNLVVYGSQSLGSAVTIYLLAQPVSLVAIVCMVAGQRLFNNNIAWVVEAISEEIQSRVGR
jgi:hypothetical protein